MRAAKTAWPWVALVALACAPGFVDRDQRVSHPDGCRNLDANGERGCRQCFARGGWYEWQKGGYQKSPSWACKTTYYYPHDCPYAASPQVRARCERCFATHPRSGMSRRFSAPDRCDEQLNRL